MKTIGEIEFFKIAKNCGKIYRFNTNKELFECDECDRPNMNDLFYERFEIGGNEPVYEDDDPEVFKINDSQSVDIKLFNSFMKFLTRVLPDITLIQYKQLLNLVKTRNRLDDLRRGETEVYVEFFVHLGDLYDRMKALKLIAEPEY